MSPCPHRGMGRLYVTSHDNMRLILSLIFLSLVSSSSAQQSNRIIRIPEDIPPGSTFHRLTSSFLELKPKNPSVLSYRILSGNSDQSFSLDSSTGELRTVKVLDRERVSSYNLDVEASDGHQRESASLSIVLEDVNDNRPIFEKSIYNSFLNVHGYSSLTRDKSVVTVKANDADVNDSVYYTLNVTSSSSEASLFTINSTSGAISANLASLIQAQNGQGKKTLPGSLLSRSSTFSLTVFALDSASTLSDSYLSNATVRVTFTHTVPATSPKLKHYPYIIELDGHRSDFRVGAQVGRIEFASLGGASSIRIEVEDHPTSHRCSDYFSVDSKTGSVFVSRNLNSNFYECFLHIKGSDEAPVTSSLLQVFFLRGISSEAKAKKANAFSLSVDVSEKATPGSLVVDVVSLSRIHSLKEGNHKFNLSYSSLDSSYFDLNTTTGDVTVRRPLDHEVLPERVEMVVLATKRSDSFDNPIYFNITISLVNVNDHPPSFSQGRYFSSIHEGQPRGTFVASVFARDLDTGRGEIKSPLRYEIEEGNQEKAFTIDSETGIVTTNSILDREMRSHYTIKIVAIESDLNESLSSSCLLDVNILDVDDNIPVFPPFRDLSVMEDAQVGSEVATLTASDADSFPKLTYRLKEGPTVSKGPFDIDLYTGKVTLTAPLKNFRREHHRIRVLASDSVHTTETEVIVKVRRDDEDLSAPNLSQDLTFVEVDPRDNECISSGNVNCIIARVYELVLGASDERVRDLKVIYRLESDPSSSFFVDSMDGILYNNRSLRMTSKKVFSVQLTVGYSRDGKRFLNGNRAKITFLVSVLKGIHVEDNLVKSHPSEDINGILASNADSSVGVSSMHNQSIPGWILFVLVFLMLVIVVLLLSIVVMKMWQQQRPNHQESMMGSTSTCSFDVRKRILSTSTLDGAGTLRSGHYTTCSSHHYMPAPDGPTRPPCYSQITNSTVVEGTSASSGRGSVDNEEEEEADQEIRMIIQGGGYGYLTGSAAASASTGDNHHHQQSISAEEYLSRLGVVDQSCLMNPAGGAVKQDEDGEVLYDDTASENWGELNPRSKKSLSTGSLRSVRRRRQMKMHNRGEHPYNRQKLDPLHEEIMQVYNWNYLKDWQPRYQKLTDIFNEIAKIKGTSFEPTYVSSRQSPREEQSYLARLETSSTISASTTNSSVRRAPRSHPTPTACVNPYSNGSFMTNPLIQPSQTSAFSPVARTPTHER